jgi:hypothetical protein
VHAHVSLDTRIETEKVERFDSFGVVTSDRAGSVHPRTPAASLRETMHECSQDVQSVDNPRAAALDDDGIRCRAGSRCLRTPDPFGTSIAISSCKLVLQFCLANLPKPTIHTLRPAKRRGALCPFSSFDTWPEPGFPGSGRVRVEYPTT